MPEAVDVVQITMGVVNENTAPGSVVSVTSTPATDWTGDAVLKINVVIRPEAADKLVGNVPINIIAQLHDGLDAVGEDRFPIIYYATTEELAAEGADSES